MPTPDLWHRRQLPGATLVPERLLYGAMKTKRTRQVGLSLGAALLLSAAASAAWSSKVSLNAKVHDHRFDRVALSGDGCNVTVKLSFNAPPKAYASKAKNRNSYLFKGRVKLKNGKELVTDVFRSSSPARRGWTQSFDTNADECWGKEKMQAVDVKVVGCRGRHCAVPDFD